MIKHIQIKDYKCLHDENLEIKPFTIVTGVNSAGKSSLIQSVFCLLYTSDAADEL